jgi:DNA-binding PadR family transcriptional regulator
VTADRQLLLLGLLRRQEMHGYQLNEFIDRQLAFCIDLKRSTAYYLLDRLCSDGYVEQEIGREGNRPERRTYRITPAGETRFQELLRVNLESYERPLFSADVGMFFYHHVPPEAFQASLLKRQAAIVQHQKELNALRASTPPDHHVVIDHHLLHVEAELRWIEQLLHKKEVYESIRD